MMKKDRSFFAKVMLFGEYSLLDGSSAFTLPYKKRKARFMAAVPGTATAESRIRMMASNQQLRTYTAYLRNMEKKGVLDGCMALEAMEKSVSEGAWLKSDIPTGYGLGSSGALVAAVFDRFADPEWVMSTLNKADSTERLRRMMSIMESFFHGDSSGIDPLCSYLNEAILVKSNEQGVVAVPSQELQDQEGSGFFLLDSEKQRKTAPLVSLYIQKKQEEAFRSMLSTRYIPCVNKCIEATIMSSKNILQQHMRELSGLQFTYFKEMIPESFHPVWEQGFSSGVYSLKLCGAGGGGYLLGYAANIRQARTRLAQLGISMLERL